MACRDEQIQDMFDMAKNNIHAGRSQAADVPDLPDVSVPELDAAAEAGQVATAALSECRFPVRVWQVKLRAIFSMCDTNGALDGFRSYTASMRPLVPYAARRRDYQQAYSSAILAMTEPCMPQVAR